MRPAATRAIRVLIAAIVWSSMGAVTDRALAASPLHTSVTFGTSILALGGSTSATINIDNTNQTSGQSAIGFVDNLPPGLTIASPSNLDNSCGGSAGASPGSVSLTDGSLQRGAVCQVTFDVKAVAAGVQSNVVAAGASAGSGDTGSAQVLVTAVAGLTGGDPVTELKGGQVNGFTAGLHPDGIASGPDGHVWFTENGGPGAVARVNGDHTVTEFRAGATSGFTSQVQPLGIATGPDGNIWFTEEDRGVARLNGNGTVTELAGGSTPGLTSGLVPNSVTAGPDGEVWFTELLDPGAIARVNGNSTVTELTGGVTSGFTAKREPRSATTGGDGHVWFTESANPGGVGRVNADGTVTEFTGGVTPGFTANQLPQDLTVGPDGHIWFTEGGPYKAGGAIARINDDGTVTEFTSGVTPGFTAGTSPYAIAAGPDGNIWFTETAGPGAVARLNADGTVSEFTGGLTPGLTAFDVPVSITAGPDGYVWFTQDGSPGIVARIAPRSPGVVTGVATGVSGTSATLQGTVNADGLDVGDCHFEYGFTTSYGTTVPCAQAVGSGTGTVTVSATIQGLDPARGYDFRLVATNAAATNVGADQRFATLPVPVVVTGSAGSIGEATATLVGTVNPESHTITDCHFDYGPTTAYGSTAACGQSAGGGFVPVAVSGSLSGLQPNTVYHYGLVATNAPGTGRGHDQMFTTLPSGPGGEPSTTPPALSGLAVTPKRFRAGRGATIRYSDSEPATTRFTLDRAQAGVRAGGRCVASRPGQRRARHARRCSRLIVVGSFEHSDLAGVNRVHLPGRVSGRRLRPGGYTLIAIASAGGVTGNRVSVRFRVRG